MSSLSPSHLEELLVWVNSFSAAPGKNFLKELQASFSPAGISYLFIYSLNR